MTLPVEGDVVRPFTASDGYVHQYRHWSPPGGTRGWIVSLHGIQSHSGWYGWSSSQLAAAGYDVRFLDRRGSGLNEQDRGYAPSAARLLEDVVEFVKSVTTERDANVGRGPIFLSAVSWGAKLAASVAAAQPALVDGLLLLYPAIRTRCEPRRWQRTAIRGLTRLGLGHRRVGVPLDDPALFTDDQRWQAFIRNDSRALHRVTLSFLNATLEIGQSAELAAPTIVCPTLVMLAGRDEIVNTTGMHDWADGLASELRTVIEYPEARHTLEFAANREQFVADMMEWIESVSD